jgi:hypothetical protein
LAAYPTIIALIMRITATHSAPPLFVPIHSLFSWWRCCIFHSFFLSKNPKKSSPVPFELVFFSEALAPLVARSHLSDAFLILFFMEQEKSYKKRKKTANNFFICRRPAELF